MHTFLRSSSCIPNSAAVISACIAVANRSRGHFQKVTYKHRSFKTRGDKAKKSVNGRMHDFVVGAIKVLEGVFKKNDYNKYFMSTWYSQLLLWIGKILHFSTIMIPNTDQNCLIRLPPTDFDNRQRYYVHEDWFILYLHYFNPTLSVKTRRPSVDLSFLNTVYCRKPFEITQHSSCVIMLE